MPDYTLHRQQFWKYAKRDCAEDPVPDGTSGGVFLSKAARHLKESLNLRGQVGWVALAPYSLTVYLQDKTAAAKIASFFEDEGWVEEREHWRDGTFHVYVLDLEPTVVKSG